MAKKPELTPALICGHCHNKAPHSIVAIHSEVETHEDLPSGITWDSGPVWELLKCPSCNNVSLRSYSWHDGDGQDLYDSIETLYPSAGSGPKGLPDKIRKAFDKLQRVRYIDADAFGTLARRLLEAVCSDKKAVGKTLNNQLDDLSIRRELPTSLVMIAHKLRNFGNIGAHSSMGELSKAEVEVIDELCRAILDYLYTAPHLVKRAELAMTRWVNRTQGKRSSKASRSAPDGA